jgi:hypothetical protein
MHCKLNVMVVDEQEFAFEADRPPKSRNTPNNDITCQIRCYILLCHRTYVSPAMLHLPLNYNSFYEDPQK